MKLMIAKNVIALRLLQARMLSRDVAKKGRSNSIWFLLQIAIIAAPV
jgi:hypothetical protein